MSAGDLELALAATREAALRIMQSFRTEQAVEYKTPAQPVTAADRDADRILRELLLAERPAYGWLSEETEDNPARLQCARVWVVDPIDGTRSFVAGRPEFAVSVALSEAGQVILGVVANPATGEFFHAVRGQGAFHSSGDLRSARRIGVSRTDRVSEAVLAASRSEVKAGEFEALAGELRIVPTGSTAYKMARVASGAVDLFISRGRKHEWDVAAGDLIVREAGGNVTDLHGRRYSYNQVEPHVHGVIATNSVLHEQAAGLIDWLPPEFLEPDAA